MSLITELLERIFPAEQRRVLILGLDAAGKTTILYKFKLGEVVTTIPTIGFNVETVDFKRNAFTFWDVGGCDKIRPLWKHYFQNTQAVIFVVDSNDRARMSDSGNSWYDDAKQLMTWLLNEEELNGVPVLVFANKQDLPEACTPGEVYEALGLSALERTRRVHVQASCAPSGDGLYEGLDWLCDVFASKLPITATGPSPAPAPTVPARAPEDVKMEDTLVEWLSREDEADDTFLEKLDRYTLESWDHRTHLRIAYLLLSRHGRREGMMEIFRRIKAFIENSPRTHRSKGTTFHETMTYFWAHMVHYCMAQSRPGLFTADAPPPIESKPAADASLTDFKLFLLKNPVLVNGGLFLHYYSKQRMLLDADSRTAVLLPDKRPLPSLLVDVENKLRSDKDAGKALETKLVPRAPLADDEFTARFEAGTLDSFGHEAKMRGIYLLLRRHGRSSVTIDTILALLSTIEGGGAHTSINYFWIHMVDYYMRLADKQSSTLSLREKPLFSFLSAKSVAPPTAGADVDASPGPDPRTDLPFSDFFRMPHCQPLRNSLFYEKYYSRAVVDDPASAAGFVIPDIKQLPSVVL